MHYLPPYVTTNLCQEGSGKNVCKHMFFNA